MSNGYVLYDGPARFTRKHIVVIASPGRKGGHD
jgi:hypothetical protein